MLFRSTVSERNGRGRTRQATTKRKKNNLKVESHGAHDGCRDVVGRADERVLLVLLCSHQQQVRPAVSHALPPLNGDTSPMMHVHGLLASTPCRSKICAYLIHVPDVVVVVRGASVREVVAQYRLLSDRTDEAHGEDDGAVVVGDGQPTEEVCKYRHVVRNLGDTCMTWRGRT